MIDLARKLYHFFVPAKVRSFIRQIICKPEKVPEPSSDTTLKVSFIGPWNYSLGLGVASKGYVTALMQANIRLNAYAVKTPLAKHVRSTSILSIHSFDGPSDVCLINLSPDLWSFALTPDDRNVINGSAVRIAMWVWETSVIPQLWQDNLGMFRAIWVPSKFTADIFKKFTDLPVEVVPHYVKLPYLETIPENKVALRNKLKLRPESKIILYVFDSMNILTRKNPNALVRAFKVSNLAEQGWQLVLKTKNLFENPESGHSLMSEINDDSAITLVNEGVSDHELSQFILGCDIYASPHSSEGFGLTVAEAMAAQKLVVATDYSATAEYLNHETGYPVAYNEVGVGADFNIYDANGIWARIDENDFVIKLQQAAFDYESGHLGRGVKARQCIRDRFSLEAITLCMEGCLARWRP